MEYWQVKQRQSLPLAAKIIRSKRIIREWHDHWDNQIYISFSGGKDSTVLLHLVRSVYPKTEAVFCDTGLEFPEIREFVKTFDNVRWLKPGMNFKKVIEKYGYPIISKDQAHKIDRIRRREYNKNVIKMYLNGYMKNGRKTTCILSWKWRYLLNAPFKISDVCCEVIKKRPFKKYENETDKKGFIGTLAVDSQMRLKSYLQNGCNAFNKLRPSSQPLSFWLEKDIWDYIHQHNLSYSKIYDMGEERTGCMFCLFGEHLNSGSRFNRMKKYHPKQYRYCMEVLNYKEVLKWYPVPDLSVLPLFYRGNK